MPRVEKALLFSVALRPSRWVRQRAFRSSGDSPRRDFYAFQKEGLLDEGERRSKAEDTGESDERERKVVRSATMTKGHQGRTTRGLTLRRKILSRVSIRAQHALPPRKNGGDRDRAAPSLFFRKRASEEASSEEARERFLKGAVTTTLALTQVMGSALATDAVLLDRAGELKNAAVVAESSAETTEREATLAGVTLVAPSVTTNEGEEKDLYRDTVVRYAGYANEVGESFKNIVSRTSYKMSYAVAICYVLADAADKGMKADEAIAAEAPNGQVAGTDSAKSSKVEMAKAAFDTLVWQGLASVIIPGFTINRIVWAAKKLTDNVEVPLGAKKWAPTLIGLSFIPFIVHPIDSGVTTLMDMTLRKFM